MQIKSQIRSIGIDLGKTTFHLVALGTRSQIVVRKKFSRSQLLIYTANLPGSFDEWQELQRRYGVECVCDATDCYVDDLLRTYNVTFRSIEGEPLRVYSKRVYVHFPIRPSWNLLHR